MRSLNAAKLAVSLARHVAFDAHAVRELSLGVATLHYMNAGTKYGFSWRAGWYTTEEIAANINSAGTSTQAVCVDRDSIVVHEKLLNSAMCVEYTPWGTRCTLVDPVTHAPCGVPSMLLS